MSNRTSATIRRSVRRAASLGALAALVTSLMIPSATFAASTTTAEGTCDGAWPASPQGKPTTWAPGARAGDYLWFDANGWKLRVNKVTSVPAVFTGRIRSDTPMTVAGVALERGDTFALSADELVLTYRFVNRGHADGLNFTTACAERVVVTGRMDGIKLPIGRIWIGADGSHPLQNPLTIDRAH
ncbi:MAG: hypothetical protein ABIP77_00750 [Candidatus Limnocylindrales bacterium]